VSIASRRAVEQPNAKPNRRRHHRVHRRHDPTKLPAPTALPTLTQTATKPLESAGTTAFGGRAATAAKRTASARTAEPILRDAVLAILVGGAVVLLVVTARGVRTRARSVRRREREGSPRFAAATPLEGGARNNAQIDATAARAGDNATDGDCTGGSWPHGHLVFVPTADGYALLERPGDPPLRRELDGEELGLNGRFRILKVAASPLPSDERNCVYLEHA
jgi:hypothetical protein